MVDNLEFLLTVIRNSREKYHLHNNVKCGIVVQVLYFLFLCFLNGLVLSFVSAPLWSTSVQVRSVQLSF